MVLTLAGGRTIRLVALRQRLTYYGLLAGRPTPQRNAEFIADALEQARTEWGGEPFLLSPPPAEWLPKTASLGMFESNALAKPGSEPYSSLTVVWFQEGFGVPDDEATLSRLRALAWEALATDWNW